MKLINRIIDAVFPRRCPVCDEILALSEYGLICKGCRDKLKYVPREHCMKCGKPVKDEGKVYCGACESGDVFFDEARAAFIYDDLMRKSIYRFKYAGRQEYAKFYAQEIYARYKSKIENWKPQVIIPVPLHKSKLKKRGYNQAYLIAKELSVLTKIPVDNTILYRDKKTEIQKNLGASDRKSNLKNAFKIKQNGVQYLSAMLVDDIYTTGATLGNASAALKGSGIMCIYCMSLSIGTDF